MGRVEGGFYRMLRVRKDLTLSMLHLFLKKVSAVKHVLFVWALHSLDMLSTPVIRFGTQLKVYRMYRITYEMFFLVTSVH